MADSIGDDVTYVCATFEPTPPKPWRKTTLWSPPAHELPHHSVPGNAMNEPSFVMPWMSSTVRSQRAFVMLKSLCEKCKDGRETTRVPRPQGNFIDPSQNRLRYAAFRL